MSVPVDWDFSTIDWTLYTTFYVSAPSCLRLRCPPTYLLYGYCALSKKAGTTNLPQGRIVSYLRGSGAAGMRMPFRNQAAVGAPSFTNSYQVLIMPTTASLRVTVAGVESTIGAFSNPNLPTASFAQYRITWWRAYDYQNVMSLACQFEKWDGAAWISLGIVYDPNNRWDATGIARCGVGTANISAATYLYFDDTEIWIPSA